MPSNNTGFEAGVVYGMFPDRIGHLHNVDRLVEPKPSVPWALDNGVFGCFTSGRLWDEEPMYRFIERYHQWKPSWVVVPDSVGDKEETLKLWDIHAPIISGFDVPLAMAVQDGMTPKDVPSKVDVVFIGGSTSWKWTNLNMWTEAFERVHVGRVNSPRLLHICEKAKVESCDGTGWFRDPRRTQQLIDYLSNKNEQLDMPW
tara:strand:- start:60 stop:662 length:603 start_codon:yes stop_codon:yes gene_type:complete